MAKAHFFVTVDAETELIPQAIEIISQMRNDLESDIGIKIPLTWFVRFQRSWSDYINHDSVSFFQGPLKAAFDGFALAKSGFLNLADRGDQIGWHYHAYNYVHRNDLTQRRRIEILSADLVSCARGMKIRHPELQINAFRFGWFFVPDYTLFSVLKGTGITIDASIHPGLAGKNVYKDFEIDYLPPITTSPKEVDGMYLFPFRDTMHIHDYDVIPHDLEWTRLTERDVSRRIQHIKARISTSAQTFEKSGGSFFTYETFLKRRPETFGRHPIPPFMTAIDEYNG